VATRHAGGASSSSAAADSDSDEECQIVFSDVPLEVVSVILQFLDPVSLAAAACVCRCELVPGPHTLAYAHIQVQCLIKTGGYLRLTHTGEYQQLSVNTHTHPVTSCGCVHWYVAACPIN
jgi:hypothetical protein